MVYRVADFTQDQVVSLIKKTKYNEGVKERFLKALQSRLFNTHPTFLASPLLTTIMLLTFEEYAEIPTKMHSFYARAFDTLFQKHDADKDQFVRKIRTGLSKEDFKLVFAAFCAMSYLDQRFSFSQLQAEKAASDALSYGRQITSEISGVKFSDFLRDLIEAVCLLQPDGLDIVFVHRSFQEYFSAVFIEKSHGARVKSLLDRFSVRFNDSVIGMALDMAKEKVEAEWVLPTIDRMLPVFSGFCQENDTGKVLGKFLQETSVQRHRGQITFSFFELDSEHLGPLESICQCYKTELGSAFIIRSLLGLSVERARELVLKPADRRRTGFRDWTHLLRMDFEEDRVETVQFKISTKSKWWLDSLGFIENFSDLGRKLESIKLEIAKREKMRADIMESFIAP